MTAEAKLLQLVQRLAERTAHGSVIWEPTADKSTYQTAFPDYGVRIVEIQKADDLDPRYLIELLDANGNIIERAFDLDIVPDEGRPEALKAIRDLYTVVRRRALGVDNALDNLLSELGKAS